MSLGRLMLGLRDVDIFVHGSSAQVVISSIGNGGDHVELDSSDLRGWGSELLERGVERE